MSKANQSKARPSRPPESRAPAMSTAALYRELDFAYRHPPTMHPVSTSRRRPPAATGHSCQPAVLEQRRRTAQLRRFLGDDTAATTSASAAASPEPAADSSTAGSGCMGRPPPPPAPSRLSQMAAAVRESRQQPCVQGADLDQALTAAHPLNETARRLLASVKEENKLLHLPTGQRVGSSATAGSVGRSLRRGLLTSAHDAAAEDRERRRRMFSMLYQ